MTRAGGRRSGPDDEAHTARLCREGRPSATAAGRVAAARPAHVPVTDQLLLVDFARDAAEIERRLFVQCRGGAADGGLRPPRHLPAHHRGHACRENRRLLEAPRRERGRLDWVSAPVTQPLRGEVRACPATSRSLTAPSCWRRWPRAEVAHSIPGGRDTRATARAFAPRWRCASTRPAPSERVVHGVGLPGYGRRRESPSTAATPARACACWLDCWRGAALDTTLVGDASLSKRPMRRVIEPLARMGRTLRRRRACRRLRSVATGACTASTTLPVASAR